MTSSHHEFERTNTPPGVSTDFLIEPDYAQSLGWRLHCLDDRPTFKQLSCLMATDRRGGHKVYACFNEGSSRKVVSLERDARSISLFLFEMSAGDVCVYDLPNTFLICVLDGDITILAGPVDVVVRCVGSPPMDRNSWSEIALDLKKDLRERLLAKYVDSGTP